MAIGDGVKIGHHDGLEVLAMQLGQGRGGAAPVRHVLMKDIRLGVPGQQLVARRGADKGGGARFAGLAVVVAFAGQGQEGPRVDGVIALALEAALDAGVGRPMVE